MNGRLEDDVAERIYSIVVVVVVVEGDSDDTVKTT